MANLNFNLTDCSPFHSLNSESGFETTAVVLKAVSADFNLTDCSPFYSIVSDFGFELTVVIESPPSSSFNLTDCSPFYSIVSDFGFELTVVIESPPSADFNLLNCSPFNGIISDFGIETFVEVRPHNIEIQPSQLDFGWNTSNVILPEPIAYFTPDITEIGWQASSVVINNPFDQLDGISDFGFEFTSLLINNPADEIQSLIEFGWGVSFSIDIQKPLTPETLEFGWEVDAVLDANPAAEFPSNINLGWTGFTLVTINPSPNFPSNINFGWESSAIISAQRALEPDQINFGFEGAFLLESLPFISINFTAITSDLISDIILQSPTLGNLLATTDDLISNFQFQTPIEYDFQLYSELEDVPFSILGRVSIFGTFNNDTDELEQDIIGFGRIYGTFDTSEQVIPPVESSTDYLSDLEFYKSSDLNLSTDFQIIVPVAIDIEFDPILQDNVTDIIMENKAISFSFFLTFDDSTSQIVANSSNPSIFENTLDDCFSEINGRVLLQITMSEITENVVTDIVIDNIEEILFYLGLNGSTGPFTTFNASLLHWVVNDSVTMDNALTDARADIFIYNNYGTLSSTTFVYIAEEWIRYYGELDLVGFTENLIPNIKGFGHVLGDWSSEDLPANANIDGIVPIEYFVNFTANLSTFEKDILVNVVKLHFIEFNASTENSVDPLIVLKNLKLIDLFFNNDIGEFFVFDFEIQVPIEYSFRFNPTTVPLISDIVGAPLLRARMLLTMDHATSYFLGGYNRVFVEGETFLIPSIEGEVLLSIKIEMEFETESVLGIIRPEVLNRTLYFENTTDLWSWDVAGSVFTEPVEIEAVLESGTDLIDENFELYLETIAIYFNTVSENVISDILIKPFAAGYLNPEPPTLFSFFVLNAPGTFVEFLQTLEDVDTSFESYADIFMQMFTYFEDITSSIEGISIIGCFINVITHNLTNSKDKFTVTIEGSVPTVIGGNLNTILLPATTGYSIYDFEIEVTFLVNLLIGGVEPQDYLYFDETRYRSTMQNDAILGTMDMGNRLYSKLDVITEFLISHTSGILSSQLLGFNQISEILINLDSFFINLEPLTEDIFSSIIGQTAITVRIISPVLADADMWMILQVDLFAKMSVVFTDESLTVNFNIQVFVHFLVEIEMETSDSSMDFEIKPDFILIRIDVEFQNIFPFAVIEGKNFPGDYEIIIEAELGDGLFMESNVDHIPSIFAYQLLIPLEILDTLFLINLLDTRILMLHTLEDVNPIFIAKTPAAIDLELFESLENSVADFELYREFIFSGELESFAYLVPDILLNGTERLSIIYNFEDNLIIDLFIGFDFISAYIDVVLRDFTLHALFILNTSIIWNGSAFIDTESLISNLIVDVQVFFTDFNLELQNLNSNLLLETPIPLYIQSLIISENVISNTEGAIPFLVVINTTTEELNANIELDYSDPIICIIDYTLNDDLVYILAHVEVLAVLDTITGDLIFDSEIYHFVWSEDFDITTDDLNINFVFKQYEGFSLFIPDPVKQEIIGELGFQSSVKIYDKITGTLVSEFDSVEDDSRFWYHFENILSGEYIIVSVPDFNSSNKAQTLSKIKVDSC